MDSREALIEAAKGLVWERGVAATSPQVLLAAAGVGQGSLYHHFENKSAWARAAIDALASDLHRMTDAVLRAPGVSGAQRLDDYLSLPRAAQAGCRLGRLAFDPAVAADRDLMRPITTYFTETRRLVADAARDAVENGELRAEVDPDCVAAALVAAIQGGYVLARSDAHDEAMVSVVRGMRALLDAASVDQRRAER